MRGKDGRKQPRRGQMVDKFRGREEIGAKKKKKRLQKRQIKK